MGGAEVKQSDAIGVLLSGPETPNDSVPLCSVYSNTGIEVTNNDDVVLLGVRDSGMAGCRTLLLPLLTLE